MRRSLLRTLGLLSGLVPVIALAQAPPEVTGVRMNDPATLSWDAAAGADDYNVYRGALADVTGGVPPRCHGDEIVGTSFQTPGDPDPDRGYAYLVTAESAGGEGTAGDQSDLTPRPLRGSCDAVMRNHVLSRAGFGWDEWTRDRHAALGTQAFLDEQLDPATIDESTNTDLNDRLATLEPPDTNNENIALDIVKAVYARRQLEQNVATFWFNHFNTEYREVQSFFNNRYPRCTAPNTPPQCDPNYPELRNRNGAGEQWETTETFRDFGFNDNFRNLVAASALSPAMILYLDTDTNVVGKPNENFARELLELHTMGVDGGYTQTDVEELARVFTGWNVCKKAQANADDPLASCISLYWEPQYASDPWVANFRIDQHDPGQKILFQGTPYETIIPDTSGLPVEGVADVAIALDSIVAHPSTPQFIVTKLLQRFVTETPTQAMIDAVVAEWNDAAHANGVGDLREVLRAVLSLPEFLDPDRVAQHVKTPIEHVASAFRGTRGNTNGQSLVRGYLQRMSYYPYNNPIPTGYTEIGADWIDTNNMLERQNFGMDFATRTGTSFGADVIGLLQDNGVSTGQGNAEAIVDFYIDVLFGGAISPSERQQAIDYLNTDDDGVASPYDNARIRETVGFLLGYPQFQEQ